MAVRCSVGGRNRRSVGYDAGCCREMRSAEVQEIRRGRFGRGPLRVGAPIGRLSGWVRCRWSTCTEEHRCGTRVIGAVRSRSSGCRRVGLSVPSSWLRSRRGSSDDICSGDREEGWRLEGPLSKISGDSIGNKRCVDSQRQGLGMRYGRPRRQPCPTPSRALG